MKSLQFKHLVRGTQCYQRHSPEWYPSFLRKSISADQPKSVSQQRHKEYQASQLKMSEMIAQKLSTQENSIQVPELRDSTTESPINSMSKFHFDPDADITFES
ncbi:hypothetical protein Smp_146890 [Schistosoma mansoni]|uniref:hypothetical protein n=1 Tax=Schistosoma mansoni TaxID=6183 RepID=UPI0001A6379B|nr:hypothetical protein Smp_146890 [Schistosoma mansoni]|eukprot:XP_018655013.1 hypothetical protein Smp_146890 [Schistosoma mansoni]